MALQVTVGDELLREFKQRFDVDGFVGVGRIVDEDALRALSERVDAICEGTIEVPDACIRFHKGLEWGPGTGRSRRDAVWQLPGLERVDEVVRGICESAQIARIAGELLGTPAHLIGSQVVLKPAHHGGVVPWHQDSSYWGDPLAVTCWLAIDDATPENGCMRFIPGSHQRGQQEFESKEFEGAPVDLLEAREVPEERQVYVPVPAGCASFHHYMTLHASAKNTTSSRRRAIAITYGADPPSAEA